MKTKFLALMMALVMLASLMPMATAAAQAPEEPGEGIAAEAAAQPVETQDEGVRVGTVNVRIEDKVEPSPLGSFEKAVPLYEGDTVLDVVERMATASDIALPLVANYGYVSSVGGVGAGDKGEESAWGGLSGGWMVLLDGWFTDESLEAFSVSGGDLLDGSEVLVAYSANMGADYGGSFDNNDKRLAALAPGAGTLSPAFDKDRDQYTLTVPPDGVDSVKFDVTPANRNFQVRLFAGGKEYRPSQAIPLTAGAVIEVRVGDASWPSMNNGTYGSGAEYVPAESYFITVERPSLGTVTVSIEDNIKHGKPDWPAPLGVMARTEVPLYQYDTAFDLVVRLAEMCDLTLTASGDYISEIGGLAAGEKGEIGDWGAMGGWVAVLNDWFPAEGLSAYTVASGYLYDGAELRMMYSLDYGADLGGTWSNNDKTLKALKFSAGTLVPAFTPGVAEYTLYLDRNITGLTVTPTATNKYFQVKTRVDSAWYTRDEVIPIPFTTAGADLVVSVGDPAWPNANDDTSPAGEYTIHLLHTTPPAIADGVANPYDATVAPGEEFSFSPNAVFVDDRSISRIAVQKPGAATTTDLTLAQRDKFTYTVPEDATGTLRLVFKAWDSDGLESPDYVVRLAVQPKAEKTLRWKESEWVMRAEQIVLDAADLLVLPAGMDENSLTFTSSAPKVVKVEKSKLIAAAAGTAQITAACTVGGKAYSAVLSVLVLGAGYDTFDLAITSPRGDEYALAYGKSVQLKTGVTPSAPVKSLVWSAANDKSEPADAAPVVRVDQSGLVTALRPGKAVVTVKATGYAPTDIGGSSAPPATATLKIEVQEAPAAAVTILDAAGNAVNGATLRLEHGGAPLTLNAAVTPGHADQDIDWKSNSALVKVEDGLGESVTVSIPEGSAKTGTATLTAKSGDGKKSATVKVSVVVPARSLTLAEKDVKKGALQPKGILAKGATVTLVPTFNDGAAQPTNKKIIWQSDNAAVATVSAAGVVKGISTGYAVIRAIPQDNPDLMCRYYVWVIAPVTSVKIDQAAFTAAIGAPVTLTATANGGAAVSTGGGVATHYAWEATGANKDKIIPASGTNLGGFDFTSTGVTAKTTVTIKVTAHTSQPSGGYAEKSHTVKVTFVPAGDVKALKSYAISKAPTAETTLLVGSKYIPKLTFDPADASQRNIDWKVTSGQKYVQLDPATGAVTAIADSGANVVTVTGVPKDGGEEKAQSYSLKTVQRATGVSLLNAPATMRTGERRKVSAVLQPLGKMADGTDVSWSSSNQKVLKVDAATGEVTAVAKGTATVTARAKDGSGKKAGVKITVVQPIYAGGMQVSVKSPKNLPLDENETPVLDAGKKATLAVTFNGGDKARQPSSAKVSWSLAPTSAPGVASVSSAGVVTALADGIATLRATAAQDGSTADFKIRVNVPIAKLAIGQKGFTLYPGAVATVDAATTPGLEKLSEGEDVLRWSITEGKGVTIVSGADLSSVTLKATGTAKATATLTVCSAANPKVKKSITVKVDPAAQPVQDVSLNKSTLRLGVGKSEKLKATLAPAKGAGNGNLRWSLASVKDANGRNVSDASAILTVDAGGKVTAKGYGSATVVVTTADGGHVATCQVLCVEK